MNIHRFVSDQFQENCFVVWGSSGGTGVIIDPGGRTGEIISFIKENRIEVKAILATHGHADHIRCVSRIQDYYPVPFYYHSGDRTYVSSLPGQTMMLGLGISQVPRHKMLFQSTEKLTFGELQFTVIETPGHSTGGVSYLIDGHCFSGDTLFAGSVGRTDLPGGNFNTLIESIQSRLMKLPPETIVHPGHGPDTSIGEEAQTNPFINEDYPHKT